MPYTVEFLERAKKHYRHWEKYNPRIADKIDELEESIAADPFTGIGKPEPLKHEMQGFWSRRITEEHRILYKVEGSRVLIHRCYGHYE
jgi:toxin YoeB